MNKSYSNAFIVHSLLVAFELASCMLAVFLTYQKEAVWHRDMGQIKTNRIDEYIFQCQTQLFESLVTVTDVHV